MAFKKMLGLLVNSIAVIAFNFIFQPLKADNQL